MNEQEFASAPIGRLFVRCTMPAMVGMGFSAIYSITDGIFVGHFIGHLGKMRIHMTAAPDEEIIVSKDKVATVKRWLDS